MYALVNYDFFKGKLWMLFFKEVNYECWFFFFFDFFTFIKHLSRGVPFQLGNSFKCDFPKLGEITERKYYLRPL